MQLSTSGDESESRRSGAGIVSQDGTRKRLKTSQSTTGGKHCSSAKVNKKKSYIKGVAVVGIDVIQDKPKQAGHKGGTALSSSFRSQSSNQSKPQRLKQHHTISEITKQKELNKKKPVIRQQNQSFGMISHSSQGNLTRKHKKLQDGMSTIHTNSSSAIPYRV